MGNLYYIFMNSSLSNVALSTKIFNPKCLPKTFHKYNDEFISTFLHVYYCNTNKQINFRRLSYSPRHCKDKTLLSESAKIMTLWLVICQLLLSSISEPAFAVHVRVW